MISIKKYVEGDIKKDYVRTNIEDRNVISYKIEKVLEKYKEEDGWYLYDNVQVTREVGCDYSLRIPLAQSKNKKLNLSK